MRMFVLAATAVVLISGPALAQNATTAPAPAPAKPSFLSRMKTTASKRATPTSSTQTTRTSAQTTSKAVATTAGGKPRTAQSIACSEKANTQNLHGKDREKFMRSCKKG